MKTQEQNSPLKQDLDLWKSQEESFAELHGRASLDSDEFRKLKLDYLAKILFKHKDSPHPADKIRWTMEDAERKKIEKQLFPRLIQRLYYRVLRELLDHPRYRKEQRLSVIDDTMYVQKALRNTGFAGMAQAMQLDFGKYPDQFKVPIAFQTAPNERVEYELFFKKDEKGYWQFQQYEARIKNATDPAQNRTQVFKLTNNMGFDAKEAYNLLKGKPVAISYFNSEGLVLEWLQLNFKEKDFEGNYNIDRFRPEYGFDLKAVIPQNAVFTGISPKNEEENLRKKLAKGDRATLNINIDGKIRQLQVEANPRERTLDYYHKGQKIEGGLRKYTRMLRTVQATINADRTRPKEVAPDLEQHRKKFGA